MNIIIFICNVIFLKKYIMLKGCLMGVMAHWTQSNYLMMQIFSLNLLFPTPNRDNKKDSVQSSRNLRCITFIHCNMTCSKLYYTYHNNKAMSMKCRFFKIFAIKNIRSGELPSKMLLIRIIENNKIYAHFRSG